MSLPSSVLVVGTGLLGTSVGLALSKVGVLVHLNDIDPEAVRTAAALGAGSAAPPDGPVDLGVVAVPPAATAGRVVALLDQGHAAYVTDVASVKAMPHAEVAERAIHPERYVGGHPMAGREVSGPGGASYDLFEGRPWVLCPDQATDPRAVELAEAVVVACGATPLRMSPAEHDAAVALVSHAPHLVSSLVAGRLAAAPEEAVRLAGPGVTDVTRVAGSDPALWVDILGANADAVRSVLTALRGDLDRAIDALDAFAGGAAHPGLGEVLSRGVAGRERLPGKHGGAASVRFVAVQVMVEDRPGQLTRLFADVGLAGVNVEDVRIEHQFGKPTGVVELDVREEEERALADTLRGHGWTVHE